MVSLAECKHVDEVIALTDAAPLELTTAAVERLAVLMTAKDNQDLRLRVYVQGGGCSGFQYAFQFEEYKAVDDFEFNTDGVAVVVDPLSYQYLTGASIDFVDDLQGTRFVVNNPNATATCCCGASFGI